MKVMKRVVSILLICLLIAGIIVIAVKGFNVGLKYSENTQIAINIGKTFEINDIKQITSEVFKGQRVIIQKVELYEDMVQITVKEASEGQINELNTKINEKYELENSIDDVEVVQNANVRLRTLIKPYILPISILSIVTILYAMIVYRKQGILYVLYTTAMAIVAPQAILSSLYAVTRIPINRLTSIIAVVVYIASITITMIYFGKKKNSNEA
jgi:preprotein translocase subunit SecF